MNLTNKGFMKNILAIFLMFLSGLSLADNVGTQLSVTNNVRYLFEKSSDVNSWSVAPAGSSKTILGNSQEIPVTEGRKALQFSMIGTASGTREIIGCPIHVTAGTNRRVRLTFDIRSKNINTDSIVVRLLQQNLAGENISWVTSEPDYIKPAPSKGWVTVEKIGTLADTTEQLNMFVSQTDGANSNGVIWIDNVTITLLSNDTTYLVDAYSSSRGNIFEADTGTMTVRSYDPNYSTLNVKVLDHTGAVVSGGVATVTYTEPNKKATVTFNQKGFYTVVAAPVNNGSPSKSWNAATIGAPVSSSPNESIGMFSVNSDNTAADAAGSKWNRYFLQTEGIVKVGSSYTYLNSYQSAVSQYAVGTMVNYPSSMLNHSQSSNQKWIVCLRGVPSWLITSTPVNVRQTVSPFRYHWQYYNDEAEFIALMTWILKDLPPDIEYVEAMNEPEWQAWGGNWTEFGNYYKALKVAFIQANIGRQVQLKLMGPVFAHIPTVSHIDNNPHNPPFTDLYSALNDFLVNQNVISSLDGISMHSYHLGNTGAPGSRPETDFLTRLVEFKQYLANIGFGSKPLIFTEFGWQSGVVDWQQPVTEEIQANYLSRALLISSGMYDADNFNIKANLAFCLKFVQEVQGTTPRYSMLQPDDTPRLPYVAYARTAKEIQPFSNARKFQIMSPSFNAFSANNNSTQAVLALWSSNSTTSSVTVPNSSASARDMYGRPVTISSNPKKVTIGESPVFVTVADSALGSYGDGPTYTVSSGGNVTVEFTDMLASSEFTLTGNSLSVQGGAATGPRTIYGKVGSIWKKYSITIN